MVRYRGRSALIGAVMLLAVLGTGCSSMLDIDSSIEGGKKVTVTATRAGKGSGGNGWLSVGEGEHIAFDNRLQRGAIEVIITEEGHAADYMVDNIREEDILYLHEFEAGNPEGSAAPLEVPPGEYECFITLLRRTNGEFVIESRAK